MGPIFKYKLLVSIAFSSIYSLLIVPINETIWFTLDASDKRAVLFAYILRVCFWILLTLVCWFLLYFGEQIYKRDRFYRSWLISTIGALGILGFLWVLVFPGWWIWDEFALLASTETYQVDAWQHIFTQIFYACSILLFPTAMTILLIQIILISLIIGYILTRLHAILKNKELLWILTPLLVLFPISIFPLYPLRAALFGYIILFLLFELIIRSGKRRQPQYGRYLFLSAVTAFVCFWRSEGIVFLLLIPLFAYQLNILATLKDGRLWKNKSVYVLVISVVFLGLSWGITKLTTDDKYQFTAVINPLSLLIHDDLSGKETKNDWENIDKVLNLDVLKKYPNPNEIEAYWWGEGLIREDATKHKKDFYISFVRIILDDPLAFIKYRLQTFNTTNSIGSEYASMSPGTLKTLYSEDEASNKSWAYERTKRFSEHNKLNNMINPTVRENIINFLLLNDSNKTSSIIRSIIWSILPISIIMFAATILTIIKRQWVWVLVWTILLTQVIIVFLTAPASNFMYYFPAYLCGYVLILIYTIISIDRYASIRRNKSGAL